MPAITNKLATTAPLNFIVVETSVGLSRMRGAEVFIRLQKHCDPRCVRGLTDRSISRLTVHITRPGVHSGR